MLVNKEGNLSCPSGRIIGPFIAGQKHLFFKEDTFHSILYVVQPQPRRFKVYENAGTLRISVQDVKDVHAAKEAMEGAASARLLLT